jgi:hypothetical protein
VGGLDKIPNYTTLFKRIDSVSEWNFAYEVSNVKLTPAGYKTVENNHINLIHYVECSAYRLRQVMNLLIFEKEMMRRMKAVDITNDLD